MTPVVNRPTAIGLSVVLHLAVLCAGLIVWPWAARGPVVTVTPVTLLSSVDAQAAASSGQSPTPQEAQTETPEEVAPPEPAATQPAPQPRPAAAPPKAAPAPKPAPKAPTPAPKTAARPSRQSSSFDPDKLAQELKTPPGGSPKSSARRGDPLESVERNLAGADTEASTTDALLAIGSKIAQHWNISCASAEDRAVVVRLRIELARDGSLLNVDLVDYDSLNAIGDGHVKAAATSAISAARAASPFLGLPQESYGRWRRYVYTFPASEICARKFGR